MRARLTYVPLEVAERFEGFIIKRDEQVLDAVRAKTKDFSTLSLLKLLYQLNSNPMTFSDLYSKSKIRMKRSFLNYLHFCIEYKFMEKERVGSNVIYTITDKGKSDDRFVYNESEKLDQNIRDAYNKTNSIEPVPKIIIRIIPRDIFPHEANK